MNHWRVVKFLQLKGIWDGRFVPIIWYHPDIFDKPDSIFPFDEKYRNELVKELLESPTRQVEINKVFDDLGKSGVIQKLIDNINQFDINADEAKSIQKAEVHVAAILFNQKNEVLCVKRNKKTKTLAGKWENGCVALGLDYESIEELVKEYYQTNFNLNIQEFKTTDKLGYKSLDLVGLYSYKNSSEELVSGIIVTGKVADNDYESIEIHNDSKYSETKWLSLDEIKALNSDDVVDGFKERIEIAYQMWNEQKTST